MYLKRLEMLGFKSFAVRTLLEFSTGITAVVGPNGAGKSNVADAVRWVLGEQSMRQLRGKKSEDIIFAGGHGKSALGMAEVSLTLDNSTGWVPSEYSEITVTRRSFRSGESEYLINKSKVRLKDVVLLLAQARIGHDSYTVVGQGLIDAALSLRAEERRSLFEDAAGIRPFQVQRLDAENRLHQTEQNLERLSDIVSEIEPRLEPLAEQAKRAAEFMKLNNALQEELFTWYALQWRRLRGGKELAETAEREQARRVQQGEQNLRAIDESGSTLRTKRQDALAAIADARKAFAEASDVVQRIEREVAVSEERITGFERRRVEQQQEEIRLRKKLLAAQQQVTDLEEQCDLADEAVDNDASVLAALEAQVIKAQKDYELDERRLRSSQNDLVQVQARLGASQTDLGRQQKHLGERNRLLAARRDWMAQSQQSIRTLETRLVEERANLSTARNEEQQVTSRKSAIGRTITDAQQEIEHLKSTLAEVERQRRIVSDRLNILKNWRQSLSGYSDGVRALLRAPSSKLAGLIAPVPRLGTAPAGMEAALEAALGSYLQAVVVRTLDDARSCLHYLQETKAGKAMVVWMEDVGGHTRWNNEQLKAEETTLNYFLAEVPEQKESIIGFAWHSIQCEQQHLPLFQHFLHGVIVVETLDTAQALLSKGVTSGSKLFEKIVTLQGEVLHFDGWLTGGGSKEDSQQGLLAFERELRELPRQLDEHTALLDELNGRISGIQRTQEIRRIEQGAVDKELQKIVSRINELNKGVTTTQREQERLQTELQLSASVEQQLAAEVAGLEQEIQAAEERVHAHEKSQRELTGLVEELQSEVEERTLAFRQQQDKMGRARTALAVKRQEAKSLHQQLATQQAQAHDLKMQLEQHLVRMKEAEDQQKGLQQAILLHRSELEQARVRAQNLSGELHLTEEHAGEIDRQIVALEKQSLQFRNVLTELEVSYRRCLLETQKAQDAVETLLEQLREELAMTDPKELSRYIAGTNAELNGKEHQIEDPGMLSEEEEAQLRKLRRHVDSLRSQIKALGGYDPEAPQLYEETRTRFEFLTGQIKDMEQAALHLRSIINQLDVSMARQFEATFQAVNLRFREHFTTLFNGGSARLELLAANGGEENGSSPSNMPAGVEVIVQPPGKKVQDLSLLSGGERALVSAALLFALLEINPPPFCLLDEVDAALDESNVTRFCDILKHLAQRTQFIVITHNRVTMMEAQVIYGVSMGSDSISRLLSLKLEEVPVAGDR